MIKSLNTLCLGFLFVLHNILLADSDVFHKTDSHCYGIALPCAAVSRHAYKSINPDDLLTVAGKALDAIRELSDAHENFVKAQKAAHEVLDGKKPTYISDDKWAGLAQKYNEAAKAIEEAPLVTDFDKSKYAVSLDELTNCNTHPQAIAKIRGYLKELQDALGRSKKARIILDDGLKFAEASDEVVSDLIKASATLASLPDIGDVFAWNWADLEIVVRPSIRNFISASKRQLKKLEQESDKVSLYESNLRGNLPGLENLCVLPGSWQGTLTFNLGGGKFVLGAKLVIMKAGSDYSGQIHVTNNTNPPSTSTESLKNITINASKQFSCTTSGSSSINAVLSADNKTLNGTMTDKVGTKATLSLTKSP